MPDRFPFVILSVMVFLPFAISCDRTRENPTPADPPSPSPSPSPAASPAPGPGAEAQLQRDLASLLSDMAERQAKGLGGGAVRVNGAWNYRGYSYLAPNPASPIPARLVAVDVTVEGHTADFDIDDIEIVDGATMVSYGSDPHFTLLDADGRPAEEGTALPLAPLPLRALLIYAFPVKSPAFKLFYWGKDLLPEPMAFAGSGWGLAYPEREE